MTFLGKVFTFIVLILSVMFFVVAAFINAKHINYRDLVENKSSGFKVQMQKELAKSKEQAELIQRLLDEKGTEQVARRVTVSALETALKQKSEELVAKEKLLTDEQAKTTLFEAKKLAAAQELAARTAENEDLRKQLIDARQDRDNQYQKFVQTYDLFMRLQGENQTLEKQSKELARNFSSAKEKLDIIGIGPNTKLDGPPAVNGVVSAVKNDMVEISIGLDDGIRIGHELDVYRGSALVGRIQITRSVSDKAIGEVMPQFAKGFIVVGDRVDSKMNELYVKRPQ